MNAENGVRFLLIPLNNFNMLPFGGFLDKLRFSADEADNSQQRYCSWEILSHTKGLIVSSSGIPINVDFDPSEVQLADFDYVVFFGSHTAIESQQQAAYYRSFIRTVVANSIPIVSIDNACFTLAELGLLNRHQVVVHWRHHSEFKATYPKVVVRDEQLYHFDRKLISCTGGSAAIDLAVAILQKHVGQIKAEKGLADMLVDENRSMQHRLKSSVQGLYRNRHMDRAVSLMQENLEQTITVEQVASLIGISRRQLDRLFQQKLGVSARHYWQELRLQHVYWRLTHSSHDLVQLADEVGVKDISYLCKIFKKKFGVTPGQCRRDPIA
ncbi:GlxA family transcriptional regulator [Vibrio bivalvicida]|uniref:AraC family transcriptional regulator n=1 Tax=Vibrio bivalvicida TaxID=1276888 RepID=A0A177Y026_9VIBR|nr:helix-turn-helix domain-containing protein [Vibrio bivalvicida]OAJ94209.1 AraC family transcriptional regulator [Vibrio bivalvicida]